MNLLWIISESGQFLWPDYCPYLGDVLSLFPTWYIFLNLWGIAGRKRAQCQNVLFIWLAEIFMTTEYFCLSPINSSLLAHYFLKYRTPKCIIHTFHSAVRKPKPCVGTGRLEDSWRFTVLLVLHLGVAVFFIFFNCFLLRQVSFFSFYLFIKNLKS